MKLKEYIQQEVRKQLLKEGDDSLYLYVININNALEKVGIKKYEFLGDDNNSSFEYKIKQPEISLDTLKKLDSMIKGNPEIILYIENGLYMTFKF